jgi:nicotinate-nucleotide adenylyltransferase
MKERHPGSQFKLIIGGDNLSIFPKWKNSQKIIEDFGLIVYPRPGSKQSELINHPNVVFIEAPLLDISATLIRKCIRKNISIRYLVPEKAVDFIRNRKLYL